MIKISPAESLIDKCLTGIEARLGWGDSGNWSNADFEKLSEVIQDKTGVALSVTTLKRIWGKVKYDNKPTVTTLNTLAQFSGFESWRVFVQQEEQQIDVVAEPVGEQPVLKIEQPPALQQTHKRKPFVRVSGVIAGLLLVSLFSIYLINNIPKRQAVIDPDKFKFSVNKVVTEGVPNSVIFNYDASAAPSDSVYIVQTWDIRRKTLVPKDKKEYSTIYYYPGYFRTKLIIDSQVVKEHDLMINTNGWLGLVEQSPIPVYFDKKEFLKDSVAEITTANFESHNIPMEPVTPQLRFFNQRDMGDLQNDNFSFETTLKSDFHKGSAACQSVQVLIQCKNDIIIIPLSAKACVGNLYLYFAGKMVTSKEADLSKFGCDLSEWTTLRVESKNRNVRLYVNNQEVYSLTFDHTPTGIVGLQYRFEGTGAVKDTWFSGQGKTYRF
jgi:hypothetical protein